MSLWVKICGVRRPEDAVASVRAGASAIGLNFAAESPRRVRPAEARAIVQAVRGRLEVVGVFVNAPHEEIVRLDEEVGFDRIQLHGEETPEMVTRFAGKAYKAVRVGAARDVADLGRWGGPWILLDAFAPNVRGGTGAAFDWALAREAGRSARVVLAGGLTPENVAEAVRAARPVGVDTASGVESAPGVKDPERIAAFVRAALRA
jgi:phosphoribosylanthranilate isomerase